MQFQCHRLTLSQQQTHVQLLSDKLLLKISTICNSNFENVDKSTYVIHNNWFASYIDIIVFINDLRNFALITINNLSESIWQVLLWNVVFLIFDIVDGFMYCVALRDERDLSRDVDCSSV